MEVDKCKAVLCLVILLSSAVNGSKLGTFMVKHGKAIQEYMMTGYGNGWKKCDLMTDNAKEPNFSAVTPQFAITLDRLLTIDLGFLMSSTNCLLVAYQVNNLQNLASLIEFGWKAIKYKRVALILKLGPGLTLCHATNVTKLPFPIAAETKNRGEQFICPFIGEDTPIFQWHMCKSQYVSMKKKILRVGMVGYELLGKYIINHCNENIKTKTVCKIHKPRKILQIQKRA